MKLERSNIQNHMWRKKVDSSLFDHKVTPIPNWASKMWGIDKRFRGINSIKNRKSNVIIEFKKMEFKGHVTIQIFRNRTRYRLWFSDKLLLKLKETYLMTYMRSLEDRLQKKKGNIEQQIPFWEFLDIEYIRRRKRFIFTPYYLQKPSFPQLFKRLIGSPVLQKVDDETRKTPKPRIIKQDWKPRSEFETEIFADNVIYMLMDSKKKLFYIGETEKLRTRFNQKYKEIPKWDYYRYDTLPRSLARYRVDIERMLIRDFATILENKSGIPIKKISNFKLVNKKIDK